MVVKTSNKDDMSSNYNQRIDASTHRLIDTHILSWKYNFNHRIIGLRIKIFESFCWRCGFPFTSEGRWSYYGMLA